MCMYFSLNKHVLMSPFWLFTKVVNEKDQAILLPEIYRKRNKGEWVLIFIHGL